MAVLNIVRPTYFVSDQAQSMMVALWYQRKDTAEIAKTLSLPEYEVANRLPILLARHKQMRL